MKEYEKEAGRVAADLSELVRSNGLRDSDIRCTCGERYFLDPRIQPESPEDAGLAQVWCMRCLVQDRVTVVLMANGLTREIRNGALPHK